MWRVRSGPVLAALRVALVGALLAAAACVPHRAGDAVRSIRFEGNEPKHLFARRSASDAQLRGAMTHAQPAWLAFTFPRLIEPAWLDKTALDSDGWRIEIWYANHGYFDARFLGWVLDRPGATLQEKLFHHQRRLRPVRVRGYVDPGEPSFVRTFSLDGVETLGTPLQKRLRALAAVKAGDVYDTDAYTATIDAVRSALQERSYAYAKVTGNVEAHPADHAVDVHVTVEAGPPCDFGPVTLVFSGTQDVPEDVVREYVTIKEGKPWRAHELATTRSALFALGTFRTVDVVPDLSDPAVRDVPIRIELTRGESREVKLGPGLELESSRASAYASAQWTDNNLAHRLWRLQGQARAGAASAPTAGTFTQPSDLVGSTSNVSPIADAKVTLTVPHFAGPAWSFVADTSATYGVETGYRYFEPSVSPGISYTWRQKFTFNVGYRLSYTDFTFDEGFDLGKVKHSSLGLDLTDPYLLSLMEQRVTYDGRNDPLQTTRGWYWTAHVAEAGGPFFGNFQFLRTDGEVRAYRSVLFGSFNPRLVVAGRVGGGWIVPYGSGPEASVPYRERLYLGGANTVRGWGEKRLGPSVSYTDTETGETTEQPAGGLLSVYGNLELRKSLFGNFGLTLFTDVGRVWDSPSNFNFSGLQWSVGGGPRYKSAIGTVHVDVGVRLGEDAIFASQPRVAWHFGLSEAF